MYLFVCLLISLFLHLEDAQFGLEVGLAPQWSFNRDSQIFQKKIELQYEKPPSTKESRRSKRY